MPAWIVEIQIPTSSAASQQEFDIGNLLFARLDMAPLKLGIKLQAIISDFILQKGDQSINRIIDSIVSNVCKLWDVSKLGDFDSFADRIHFIPLLHLSAPYGKKNILSPKSFDCIGRPINIVGRIFAGSFNHCIYMTIVKFLFQRFPQPTKCVPFCYVA